MVSRSPYSFRKISNIKNYITGLNKQPKTYLKHIQLDPRNTNDCKEELVFFVCRNTKTSAKIIVFKIENFEQFYIAGREHSTRDSRGQRLISINPVVTEPTCREPP